MNVDVCFRFCATLLLKWDDAKNIDKLMENWHLQQLQQEFRFRQALLRNSPIQNRGKRNFRNMVFFNCFTSLRRLEFFFPFLLSSNREFLVGLSDVLYCNWMVLMISYSLSCNPLHSQPSCSQIYS